MSSHTCFALLVKSRPVKSLNNTIQKCAESVGSQSMPQRMLQVPEDP